jgi:hypothetical protein
MNLFNFVHHRSFKEEHHMMREGTGMDGGPMDRVQKVCNKHAVEEKKMQGRELWGGSHSEGYYKVGGYYKKGGCGYRKEGEGMELGREGEAMEERNM